MKTNKYSRFFAILKQVNANGLALTKEQAVSDFTDQRSESLSSLSDIDLAALERSLSGLIRRDPKQPAPKPAFDPTADKLRKGIISQFLSIGKTVDDAKGWSEKNGVKGNKRLFNDYTNQELYLLFQIAKKMKRQHITAVTKR